jgi:hypothetical protein
VTMMGLWSRAPSTLARWTATSHRTQTGTESDRTLKSQVHFNPKLDRVSDEEASDWVFFSAIRRSDLVTNDGGMTNHIWGFMLTLLITAFFGRVPSWSTRTFPAWPVDPLVVDLSYTCTNNDLSSCSIFILRLLCQRSA